LWIDEAQVSDDKLIGYRFKVLFEMYEKWAKSSDQKKTMSYATFFSGIKEFLQLKGLKNKYDKTIVVTKVGKERAIISSKEKDIYGDLDAEDIMKKKFEKLVGFTKVIAEGYQASLIVTGDPGIGKTRTIRDTLKKVGQKYKYFTGSIKRKDALYKLLYDNNDADLVLVFDDTGVEESKPCVELLKGVMNYDNDRVLTIDIGKDGHYPSSFKFEGRIIIISNRKERDIDSSLVSRALKLELTLAPDQAIERIKNVLKSICPNTSIKIKEEVYEFLKGMVSGSSFVTKFDLRFFQQAVALAVTNNHEWKDWVAEMAINYR
jgi:hypothetical protein